MLSINDLAQAKKAIDYTVKVFKRKIDSWPEVTFDQVCFLEGEVDTLNELSVKITQEISTLHVTNRVPRLTAYQCS